MDIRLKTVPFEYGGHCLNLCCNMNVLAELQETGGLDPLLDEKRSFRSFTRLLAAMVNEAADSAGIGLVVTDREIGRSVSWKEFRKLSGDIFGLLAAAIVPPDEDAAEPNEDASKNVETSEATATA